MDTEDDYGTPQVLWAEQAQLGEGLCWSARRQAVYWVDILGQRLMRFHPATGRRESWYFDEPITAVAERAFEPGLIVTLRRCIALFDPDRNALTKFGEVEPHVPGNRFNDGKCDAQGRFWAGTMDFDCEMPSGSLYRVSPGQPEPRVTRAWACGFPVTNGPAWTADGTAMWLNDTVRNIVYKLGFDEASGAVFRARAWLRLREGDGVPDGMTTDAEGCLWIAHWGGGCVTRHAPDDGRELARIALPASQVTNVCFGGADFRTLFITSAATGLDAEQRARQPLAGSLFAVRTPVTGRAPHRFAG